VTPFERRVRAAVYAWLLGTSRAPERDTLAASLAATPDEVDAALRRLAELHALVLAPGSTDIWMAHPFSALPTPFRVDAGDRAYYACCAWDAAGILSLVGDGRCTAACGDCGDDLSFEVAANFLRGDAVVHFLVPARHFWDDIAFT